MRKGRFAVVAAASLAYALCLEVQRLPAANESELIRDLLRQQSGSAQAGCTGVQRALVAGTDARIVVRTAVELGNNSCQTIRCALEAQADREKNNLCEQVVRGAAEAGVQADVIARCSSEYCDPGRVAAVLEDAFLEPNYCYFMVQPLVAPEPLLLQQPVIDRAAPVVQFSPFSF